MIKRKKTLQSDAMNHNNKCCHSAHNDEQQQHAAAAAAACSSSCSNISIATHRAAAAEIHGRYIQLHTRTSYSNVQLSSIVIIYQVQVLSSQTWCFKKSRKNDANQEACRDLNPRLRFLRECSLLFNHQFPCKMSDWYSFRSLAYKGFPDGYSTDKFCRVPTDLYRG